MKNLVIIGGGGFGREVWEWAQACEKWSLKGVLDDNPEALGPAKGAIPYLGPIQDYTIQEDDIFVCGIGQPKAKKAIIESLQAKGACFVNVIHPTTFISPSARLGVGIVICPYSVISSGVILGDHLAINLHCQVGESANLGAYVQLSSFSNVGEGARLKEQVFLASHATILPGKSVGARASIGAGTVVSDDVAPGTTIFGNPAQVIWREK